MIKLFAILGLLFMALFFYALAHWPCRHRHTAIDEIGDLYCDDCGKDLTA